MTARFSNQFQSYLTEPLNIDATVIKIPPEDVKRLPILNDTDWFPLNISDPRGYEEIVHVTKVNVDGNLTVKRAQEGTEAKNFRVESRVDIRLTAQSIESFLGLYYGARTVPPSNAQTGAAYLDISQKPNALKVLGDNGWANAVSYSLAGLRQQLFVPTEATKGPFTVPGGFTSGFANVNGLSVYAGHGMTIDAANASFKLDNEVPAGTIIVFQGYLANDAVDVFTKAEINERFSNLSTSDLKETDDRKFLTADEREKIANLDDHYLSKSGGTVNGNLDVSQDLKGCRSLKTNGWVLIENDGTDGLNNYGIRLTVPEKKADHTAEITLGAEGELRVGMASSGFAFQCYQNGYVRVKSGLIVGDGNVVLGTTGDIFGGVWVGGNLSSHIENRCVAFQNACVTNSRIVGWADVRVTVNAWGEMPNGYLVTCAYYEGGVGGQMHIGGRQPQLFIANRGWFALGEW